MDKGIIIKKNKRRCEICGEHKDNLTPFWNSNVEIGYEKVCEDCHNQYDDYFVIMKPTLSHINEKHLKH